MHELNISWHSRSRVRSDGGGRTGGTQGEGTVTGRQELLVKWGSPERSWIGAASAAGPAAHEGENIYKTIYISPVCVGVKAVLRGEVGATDRGWYNKIRFGTYNIRNGRDGGLESALHRMSQANMDLGVFQETNLTKRIDTHKSSGYQVVATEAPSAHSGGVAMLYRAVYH